MLSSHTCPAKKKKNTDGGGHQEMHSTEIKFFFNHHQQKFFPNKQFGLFGFSCFHVCRVVLEFYQPSLLTKLILLLARSRSGNPVHQPSSLFVSLNLFIQRRINSLNLLRLLTSTYKISCCRQWCRKLETHDLI